MPRLTIRLGDVGGPVLAIVREDDRLWPAAYSARMIIRELEQQQVEHHFDAPIYSDAGHHVGPVPYVPSTGTRTAEHRLTGEVMHSGGSPAADAAARADGWPRMLAFLAEEVPGGDR